MDNYRCISRPVSSGVTVHRYGKEVRITVKSEMDVQDFMQGRLIEWFPEEAKPMLEGKSQEALLTEDKAIEFIRLASEQYFETDWAFDAELNGIVTWGQKASLDT